MAAFCLKIHNRVLERLKYAESLLSLDLPGATRIRMCLELFGIVRNCSDSLIAASPKVGLPYCRPVSSVTESGPGVGPLAPGNGVGPFTIGSGVGLLPPGVGRSP